MSPVKGTEEWNQVVGERGSEGSRPKSPEEGTAFLKGKGGVLAKIPS